MNQLSLAMKLDVAQETISAYENGKSYPSVATLLKLCDIFDASADFLLDRTDVKYTADAVKPSKTLARRDGAYQNVQDSRAK